MRYCSAFALLTTLTTICEGFSVNRVFVSTPSQTEQRLVQDWMTPNPVCLKTTDTVDEAIAKLLHLGFNGAPVVDPLTFNLVGVISAFDVLAKEEGGTLLHFVQDGNAQNLHQIADVARKICAKTVEDLMTPNPLTISPTITMKVAAEIMTRDRCHRLCVVDQDGSLVGLLATSDVMRHVLKIARRALPEGVDLGSIEDDVLSP
jgi:CBS domain-containing protein